MWTVPAGSDVVFSTFETRRFIKAAWHRGASIQRICAEQGNFPRGFARVIYGNCEEISMQHSKQFSGIQLTPP